MRIVIGISDPRAFESLEVCDRVCGICDHVAARPPGFLLTPQRGKLMDLLKLLSENDIPYNVEDLSEEVGH